MGRGLGGVEDGYDAAAGERCIHIGKPDRRRSGLMDDRQSIKRGPLDQTLGHVEEIGREAHVALETTRERLACDRDTEGLPCCRDPEAASWQPPPRGGHGRPTRAENKTDPPIPRFPSAGGAAKPSRGGRALARSGVEWIIGGGFRDSSSKVLKPVRRSPRPSRQAL